MTEYITRLLEAGYLLAELSGRVEPGPSNANRFASYPPDKLAGCNIAGKVPQMVAVEINKMWNEDAAQTERVEALLAGCNAPKIILPGRSVTWVMKYTHPFRTVRTTLAPVNHYGFTVHGPDSWGLLLPPSLLMTTRCGLTTAEWEDPDNIAPVEVPERLLKILTDNALVV